MPRPEQPADESFGQAENGMDFADAPRLGATAQRKTLPIFGRRFIEMANGTPVRATRPYINN